MAFFTHGRLLIISTTMLFLFVPHLSQAAIDQNQLFNNGFTTFYLEGTYTNEDLTKMLQALSIEASDATYQLRIETDSDPYVYTKPTSLLRVGQRLLPLPEDAPTSSIGTVVEGTKVSLIRYRVLEALPGDLTTVHASNVTLTYHEDAPLPFTFEGSYTSGKELVVEGLFKGVVRALQQGETRVPVVMVTQEPVIHTVNVPESIGPITDVVAYGVSDFAGSSEDRIHNIDTAIAKFNGVLVRPGEEFSFNSYLGEVDGSTGYRKELVIKGDRTIPEYGGGVCQVSSTVYRAAFYGGLPITERKNHSYAVQYYKPWGSDATIYPGVVDFKFRNDTAHSLVMQAYREDPQVHFIFYGVKDDRSVEIEGPYVYNYQNPPAPRNHVVSWLAPGQRQLIEGGVTGFQAHWKRVVTYTDGRTEEYVPRSNYEARPLQYYVGPAPVAAPAENTENPA